MSVSYSSRFGYGYIVERNEYRNLSDKLRHEFQESEYALAIDGWDIDGSTYFFGLIINAADPSGYFMVPAVISYDHEQFLEMMNEFKILFPNRASYMPRQYVLSCVD